MESGSHKSSCEYGPNWSQLLILFVASSPLVGAGWGAAGILYSVVWEGLQALVSCMRAPKVK
jgi:hypothetical protein